jgi:hypothetical protein
MSKHNGTTDYEMVAMVAVTLVGFAGCMLVTYGTMLGWF